MYDRVILVLLGKRGAGKTSLAKMFVRKKNFLHIEMSEYLNDLKSKTQFKNIALRNFVEITHSKNGEDFFIQKLCSECLINSRDNFVITGVRHLAELNYLNNHLSKCKLIFVYLKVNFLKRLARITKRENRNSLSQFLIEEYYSEKWGNNKLKSQAIKINSSGDIDTTFQKLNDIISQ